MSDAVNVIDVARKYLGMTGEGYGRGPQIEKWLAEVGLPPGDSWCAAFVHGCFLEADPDTKCPRTGGALRLWELSPATWRVKQPQAGDVYVIDHGHGLGHTGIIESVDDDKAGNAMVEEISGNTNAAGARTGNSVARHWWNLTFALRGMPVHEGKLVGFIRVPQGD